MHDDQNSPCSRVRFDLETCDTSVEMAQPDVVHQFSTMRLSPCSTVTLPSPLPPAVAMDLASAPRSAANHWRNIRRMLQVISLFKATVSESQRDQLSRIKRPLEPDASEEQPCRRRRRCLATIEESSLTEAVMKHGEDWIAVAMEMEARGFTRAVDAYRRLYFNSGRSHRFERPSFSEPEDDYVMKRMLDGAQLTDITAGLGSLARCRTAAETGARRALLNATSANTSLLEDAQVEEALDNEEFDFGDICLPGFRTREESFQNLIAMQSRPWRLYRN